MKTKSFTLIELLVVIVIIGILAAVIIVSTSSSIGKANIAKVKVFESNIQNELGANMVSRWKLDGNANDAWGGNNGALVNDPTLKTETECVTGSCYLFNGSNDYIDFGNANELNLLGNMTISFWINPSTYTFGGGAAHIFGNGISSSMGYNIWLYEAGHIQYRTNQPGYQQVTNSYATYIPVNKWTNITITRSGNSAKTYIDGVDRTDFKGVHIDPTTSTKNIIFGCYTSTSSSYFFNGLLDDVRIYNGALSTSQIKQEYIAGLNSLLANNNISEEEYDQRLEKLALNK